MKIICAKPGKTDKTEQQPIVYDNRTKLLGTSVLCSEMEMGQWVMGHCQ